jgi:predicted ATPase
MITKWKVFNFKSVRQETELEFAPLTIFAGINSSGKSTFLQSILLVAQTLTHKVSSRSVVLNGALTQLGQFDDLRSVDSDAAQVVIGWTCEPMRDQLSGSTQSKFFPDRMSDVLASVSCEIAFDTDDSGAQKEMTQIQPRLFASEISAVVRDPEAGDRHCFMGVRRATAADDVSKRKWIDALQGDDPQVRESLQYHIELDEYSLNDIHEDLISAEPIGCLLRHFLPDRLSLGVNVVEEDIRLISNTLLGEIPRLARRWYRSGRDIKIPAPVLNFVLEVAGNVGDEARTLLGERLELRPELLELGETSLESFQDALRRIPMRTRVEIRRELAEAGDLQTLVGESLRGERKEELAVIQFRCPLTIAQASSYLDQFFSTSVRYLGPLRDEPKSLYPLAPTADPSDVGIKGEHTAAVLDLHKSTQVRYIPTSAFAEAEIKGRPTRRSLEAAVTDWLHYLGVAEGVQTRDRGKFGHELTVSVDGDSRSHDLTHVGVGVSQVLPILVLSLLADPDTTLIFEQPELHLHPKVQTLLADFFLSMTALGKQCVVETHSEYLINRVRFRTAAAVEGNPWLSRQKMYFVERPSEGSTFREVEINEFGAVVQWPEGFFDQSQKEAEEILRAASKKRKLLRGN